MCPDMTEALAGVGSFLSKTDPHQMSGLPLAFIGDTVYDIFIRSYILSLGEPKVDTLHKQAVNFANAAFQAEAIDRLLPVLTEEELGVYKRGRNAHSTHTPKNKSEAQYHKATGFEALFGFLFLLKRYERLNELFQIVIGDAL